MKSSFIVCVSFILTLLVATSSVYAYLPLTVNNSLVLSNANPRGLGCNQNYCYLVAYGSGVNSKITRVNLTGGAATTCTITNQFEIKGFMLINDTFAVVRYSTGCELWNMTNIGGVCGVTQANYGSCAASTFQNGAYDLSTNSLYWSDLGITDFNFTAYGSSYWAISSAWNRPMIPNASNPTILYSTKVGDLGNIQFVEEYNSQVLTNIYGSAKTFFNIGSDNGSFLLMSLVKNSSSTTWAYFYDGARFYKANYSQALVSNAGTTLTLTEPINNLIISEDTTVAKVSIIPNNNGTLRFYLGVNGSYSEFYNVTVYNSSAAQVIAATTPQLTLGQTYGVYATFTDQYSNYFNTTTNSFTYSPNSFDYFAAHPFDSLALAVGSLFSIYDLATAHILFSVLFTIITALICVIVLSLKADLDGSAITTVFSLIIMVVLGMFAFIGWFSTWYFAAVIILLALLLFYIMQRGN